MKAKKGPRTYGQSGRNDKENYVRKMFDAIAPTYDLMNLVITLGLWRYWQRRFLSRLALTGSEKILDVGSGTAELALLMGEVITSGRIVGVDLSREMLRIGREKIRARGLEGVIDLRLGNAVRLEFDDGEFDVVTSGFVLRNVADLPCALKEMARVTRPGGRVVCMELTWPENLWLKWPYFFYFYWIVPVLGWLAEKGSGKGAYTYLPHSLKTFPPAPRLAEMFREAGLTRVSYQKISGGIVAIHTGFKPEAP